MNEALSWTLAALAGGCFGLFFFGGLWWTVRKGIASSRTAFWFFGSMLTRMSIVLAGFYWVGRDSWRRLIVGLLGFIIARFVVIHLTRPRAEKTSHGPKEISHAH